MRDEKQESKVGISFILKLPFTFSFMHHKNTTMPLFCIHIPPTFGLCAVPRAFGGRGSSSTDIEVYG
jgi:hypothetical protein